MSLRTQEAWEGDRGVQGLEKKWSVPIRANMLHASGGHGARVVEGFGSLGIQSRAWGDSSGL